MTVTYATLKDSDPDAFGYASQAWAVLCNQFSDQAKAYDSDVLRKVHTSGWSGLSGMAAREATTRVSRRLTATADLLLEVSIVLGDAQIEISRAQDLLHDAERLARKNDLEIDDAGNLYQKNRPPLLSGRTALTGPLFNKPARDVEQLISKALRLATDTDDRVCKRLRDADLFGKDGDGRWVKGAHSDLQKAAGLLPRLNVKYGDAGKDQPLRPWNVDDPSPKDRGLHELMKGAVVGLSATGRPTAATLLKHWLENSGDPQIVSPQKMMQDIPPFKADVNSYLAQHEGDASFDSGWINEPALNHHRDTDAELDWYYALNDFRYRIVGTSSFVDGHSTVEYTVEVYKNYQFNAGRTPISIPHTGADISQGDLENLNKVGLAHDFVVTGSSYFGGRD